MLLCQNSRRTQHHDLLIVLRCLKRRAKSHFCFPKAHITTDQSIHWMRGLHVGFDIRNCRKLIGRLLIRKTFFHFALCKGVLTITIALCCSTTCIHINQVKCKLFGSLARLGKSARPIRGIKTRKARRRPFRTHVARHAVELLDGHIELVAFRVFKQKIIAL